VSIRAGAHVTILHRGERLLQGFDPDLVAHLTQKTRSLGADIRLHTEGRTIEKSGERLIVHASDGESQHTFPADLVVHGAGRVADIEELDLRCAGVEATEQGVKVNDYLQSPSNPPSTRPAMRLRAEVHR
jgi:glutathione reductase (NADPH)